MHDTFSPDRHRRDDETLLRNIGEKARSKVSNSAADEQVIDKTVPGITG